MCFVIDKSAPIPRRRYVYKVFAINALGALVSPYASRRSSHAPYEMGVTRDIRIGGDSVVTEVHGTSAAGLYVFLDLKGALGELKSADNDHGNGEAYVLVRCAVDPANYIHSSRNGFGGRKGRTATYFALTPVQVVKSTLGVNFRSSVYAKAIRKLKAFKQTKVKA